MYTVNLLTVFFVSSGPPDNLSGILRGFTEYRPRVENPWQGWVRSTTACSRPRSRPDLFEVKAKAKATTFCPRALLGVKDSPRGPLIPGLVNYM